MSLLKKLIDQALLAVILSLMFFMSDTTMAKVFDRVVAKVNSEIITLSSVNERVELLRQQNGSDFKDKNEKEVLDEALNSIVEEKLQLQEGKKRGLSVDDSAVEAAVADIEKKNGLEEGQLAEMLKSEGRSVESYKNHIRDQILLSKVVRFELGSRVSISERKIAKYYYNNQKDFWNPGKARVRHILILTEKELSADKKKEKYLQAKEILGEVKRGKDFANAAKEYSEDISASEGGDVGFVEKGKMVPDKRYCRDRVWLSHNQG
jgi:peptidyl-prolyl cis-trans isomerase SurA